MLRNPGDFRKHIIQNIFKHNMCFSFRLDGQRGGEMGGEMGGERGGVPIYPNLLSKFFLANLKQNLYLKFALTQNTHIFTYT